MQDQSLSLLRIQLASIILGTVFLFFGLTACVIAAIRKRTGVRILIWLGIWSGMYGTSLLARTPAIRAALPRSIELGAPFAINAIRYLLMVAAMLAWSELTTGGIRQFTRTMTVLALAIAFGGIGSFFVTGSGDELLTYNNLLAFCALLVLAAVVVVPRLSRKYLLFSSRILTAGTLAFAIDALYRNLVGGLRFRQPSLPLADELTFGGFLFSFAYVAGQNVFAKERRLLSIQSELEIARQIQTSILPAGVPEMKNLRIAAAYQPMTAVGGDFYEFIQIAPHRLGVLLADVSGHGIPAALIASMVKVAVQTLRPCADDPAELLRRLNGILSGLLRGQFVSASYLWIDTESAEGLYSAAGHPPLLRWREGSLKRIESNGLLFGVMAACDYPVCTMQLKKGDRFLLYTDGLVEPENTQGESFGDSRLEEVIRDRQSLPPLDFTGVVLSELGRWQSALATQHDDITLIVIDVG